MAVAGEIEDWELTPSYADDITSSMKMCLTAKLCGVGNFCVRAPVVPASGTCSSNSLGPCTACGNTPGNDCTSIQLCENGACISPPCENDVNGPCTSCGAAKRDCTLAQICNVSRSACMNIQN